MDMIMHLLAGIFIVIALRETKLNFTTSFIVLFMIAFSKEFYNHNFILGHVGCYMEHFKDMFFTMIPSVGLVMKVKEML